MEDDPTLARAVDSHAGFLLTNPVEPNQLARRTGIVGNALESGEEPDYLKSRSIPYLRVPSGDWAAAMWFQFRAPPPVGNVTTLMHQTGPHATADNIKITLEHGGANLITGIVDVRGDPNPTFQYTTTNQWYFLTFNYRDLWSKGFYYNGLLDIRTAEMMAAGTRTTHRVESNYAFQKTGLLTLFANEDGTQESGSKPYLVLDEVVLFNQPLTDAEQEWLYNSNSGRAYSELAAAPAVDDECEEEIECCTEDDFGYVAAGKTIQSVARDVLGNPPPGRVECDENPVIHSIPETGSCVFFPVQVQLSCETLNVELYYTTDGSDPEDSVSGSTQLWDGTPITLNDATEQIRVRPVVAGCPTYPVRDIQYSTCFPFELTWLCTNTDKVGPWGVWSTDGNPDHNWTLRMELPGTTEIQRVEIYELDENMAWATGQAWATNTPIKPFPTDQNYEFSVYPLKIEDAGVPLETDYVDTLGNFSGSIDWDLFGDIRTATPANHFFHIKVFTAQYGVLEQILPTSSCETPIIIYPTIPLTVSPQCSNCDVSVDWEFTVPAAGVGGSYVLKRRRICLNETETTEIASGSGVGAGLISGSDDPLPSYCRVEYHLQFTFPTGAISNFEIEAQTLGCPTGLLNADTTNLVPGGTFNVRVKTENAGGGACGAQLSVKLNGGHWFYADWNTDIVHVKDVDDLIDGTNEICITPCNACGSGNQLCNSFEYNPPAECDDTAQSGTYEIEGWQNDQNWGWGTLINCGGGGDQPWGGTFNYANSCQFNGVTGANGAWIVDDGGNQHKVAAIVNFYPTLVPSAGWVMIIYCWYDGFNIFWIGTKTTGDSPEGTYDAQVSVDLGGGALTPQSNTPAQITLVEQ
jgi:hypothetical protein